MTERYGPFDAGSGSSFAEDDWYKLMKPLADGIIYQSASEITTPYTGLGFGALKVTAAGGLDINIAVGTASVHGGLYENTATLTKTLAGAPVAGGQTRHDIVVLNLDRTANTVAVAIVNGIAATTGTQTDPPLSKSATTWQIPLARVAIATGTINISAGNITDARQFAFITQTLAFCRLSKTSNQTAAGGTTTWTQAGGNASLFSSNSFVIPCNGLWTVQFYARHTLVGSITWVRSVMTRNGTEMKRQFISTNGGGGEVGFSTDLTVNSYPFRAGDVLLHQSDQGVSTTSQIDTTSFGLLRFDGPSGEPI